MALNLKINIKDMPQYLKVIILVVPAILLITLFFILVYSPKQKEINTLKDSIAKLDNEIANCEVKVRKLEELKIENMRLKRLLVELQEQLPEEKEVSVLLKQISDLGLKSGLEILLWRPEARVQNPSGLYVEIPVKVEVEGGYHNLGVFFSQVSQLKRIVNISDITMGNFTIKEGFQEIIKANFTASTFSALEKPVTEGAVTPTN